MYESILLKLKTQRDAISAAAEAKGAVGSRVSDRTLEAQAKVLAVAITTQEQVDAIDFTEAINGMDGNIAHIAAKEVTAFKAKTPAPAAPAKTEPAKKPDEIDPVVKALSEKFDALNEKYNALTSQSIAEKRKAQFEATLNGMPPVVAEPLKKAFGRMQFESDESFAEYLGTVQADKAGYEQSVKEGRLPSMVPRTEVQKPVDDGTTPLLSKALKQATEAAKTK